MPANVLIVQRNGNADQLYSVNPSTKRARRLREPLTLAIGAGKVAGAAGAHEPVWSHDGAFIAYSIQREARFRILESLFVMRRHGSERRQIAKDVGEFRWSPTANVLAFDTFDTRGPTAGVYVARAASGLPRRVAAGGSNPQWRADRTILFERNYGDLFSVREDGGGVVRLGAEFQNVVVSPDGELVAFQKMNLTGGGDYPLEIMSASPWGKERHTVRGSFKEPFRLSWSPDSSRLAFLPGSSNHGAALYLVNVASNTVNIVRKRRLRIRNQAVWPHDFEWDPSGTKFALEAGIPVGSGQQAKGLTKIWIMNVDGSSLSSLRTGWSFDPSVNPHDYCQCFGLSLLGWERAARLATWER